MIKIKYFTSIFLFKHSTHNLHKNPVMLNKIKILHLTTDAKMGGTEKMILAFVKNCSGDFQNTVVTLKGNGPLLEEALKYNACCLSLNLKKPLDIWKSFKLYKILKEQKPDILHTYLFHSNIAGKIIGKSAGIKHIICGQRNIDSWRKWYHILIDRFTSSFSEAVISNTKAGKKRLIEKEKLSPHKITVIYNGINEPDTPHSLIKKGLKIDKNAKLLLNIGSFFEKKGHSILIRSFAEILKKNKNLHLILAGEGPLRSEMKSLATELSIKDNIHFLGFRKDIFELLSSSILFILPSLWEGMPNVVLEAMSQGIPVIASSVGGVPEIIEDNIDGFLIPPNDPKELTKKILYALDNPEHCKEISLKAQEKVKTKFSMKKMITSLEEFYRKTI